MEYVSNGARPMEQYQLLYRKWTLEKGGFDTLSVSARSLRRKSEMIALDLLKVDVRRYGMVGKSKWSQDFESVTHDRSDPRLGLFFSDWKRLLLEIVFLKDGIRSFESRVVLMTRVKPVSTLMWYCSWFINARRLTLKFPIWKSLIWGPKHCLIHSCMYAIVYRLDDIP